ncbi:MAG TPA: hypothetical protein VLG46_11105 [Anaerolineae bacterium]|nr:hypothetical protein [Anaerolineae bacterium]
MVEPGEFQKLEAALIEAGQAIEYPRTPPLAAQVRREVAGQLHGEQRRERPRPLAHVRFRPALVVALAVIAALALLLIIPETREAIAQLLGLRNIRIIEATPTPVSQRQFPVTAPATAATPAPTPTRGVVPFKQCCPTTLAEAQQQARFKILLPPAEQPTQVFFQDQIFGRGSDPQQVVLVFGDPDRPHLVLYQATRLLYEKMIRSGDTGTVITETQVSGRRALWLTGAPHVLVTLDVVGNQQLDLERPVNANTLIWETGDRGTGVTYRLETLSGLATAVEFAESLR